MNMMKNSSAAFSRRDFLRRSACAMVGLAVAPAFDMQAAGLSTCPVVVFSKLYQELKLDFEASADVTAEAGLDGIDCPVRPGGEVLPERVEEDLPRYAAALSKRGVKIGLLTTGITGTASPHAEKVLRTAKKLGITYYRLGFFKKDKDRSPGEQAAEIAAGLNDLAALSREVGVCGLFQNHTGSFGADLSEMVQVLKGFRPEQIGAAFDIGHALAIHGDGWRPFWEKIKPHLRVAYVKDARKGGGWTRFGQGAIAESGYFTLLKQTGYTAPVSLHIEFDWSLKGKEKTREAMVKALRESNSVLRGWLREA